MPFDRGNDGIPEYEKADYTNGPCDEPSSIDSNVIDDRIHPDTETLKDKIQEKPMDNKNNEKSTMPYAGEDRVHGFGERSPFSDAPKTQLPAGVATESFVCGWLVVIDGPGKGRSVVVGPGQSAISRSAEGGIRLDFGDMFITNKQQVFVFYDDIEHEFVVAPGNGSSLNRLNGQLLATPTSMNTGDILKVGATTLRFVAFCDRSFNWHTK